MIFLLNISLPVPWNNFMFCTAITPCNGVAGILENYVTCLHDNPKEQQRSDIMYT